MNIFDFDNTIYDGDSCKDIVMYGLKKHFLLTMKSLIKASKLNRMYKKNLIPFEKVKEELLSFIFKIDSYEDFINNFVNDNMKKIKSWYKDIKKPDDIFITASYELWISEFAKQLGIKNVIATRVDKKGHIIGKNCKTEEKVSRLKEEFPSINIKCAYTDSKSDIPILKLAKKAYVVEGNKLNEYFDGYSFKNTK